MHMWKNIKLILKSVRQYKKYAIITPFFMIFESLIECALPFVMSIFGDAIKPAYEKGLDFNQTMTTVVEVVNPTLHSTFKVTLVGCILTLVVMAILSMICGFGWKICS